MPFSSTSKETLLADTVLSVRDLHLVFRPDVYRSFTWRDAFTRLATDPLGTITNQSNRLHVLQGLSFDLKRGDRVALIGVNGTGKTSLCRCIAGIYHQTSGTIRTAGTTRAIFDTTVGIHPELTGRENAELLAEFMYARENFDRDALLKEALEFSELGKFLDVPFKTYSNGMQARLCLSIISGLPAELLILDEVFEGADAFFREKVSARVLNLIQRSGAALFVSHSDEQVRKVCNRALVLEKGQIVFDGDVDGGLKYYAESSQRFGS